MGRLKQQHSLSESGGCKSEVKVLTELVSGEDRLSGLQMAVSLCVLTSGLGVGTERGLKFSCVGRSKDGG